MMNVLDPATNEVRGCVVIKIFLCRIYVLKIVSRSIAPKTIAEVASLGAEATEDAITVALDSWTDWRQLLAKGDTDTHTKLTY